MTNNRPAHHEDTHTHTHTHTVVNHSSNSFLKSKGILGRAGLYAGLQPSQASASLFSVEPSSESVVVKGVVSERAVVSEGKS